jgi:hypothetical protein
MLLYSLPSRELDAPLCVVDVCQYRGIEGSVTPIHNMSSKTYTTSLNVHIEKFIWV